MKLSRLFRDVTMVRANVDFDLEINDIRYHSEKVQKGDLFVAVKGSATNGHKYIGDALSKGAACIICESEPQDTGIPFVLVPNSRKALAQLSKNYFDRPDEKLKLIGVTGTNGKTSTTYLIREILMYQYGNAVGLIGTNQNLVGSKPYEAIRTTPQSYDIYKLMREMVDAGCKYAVMEVSSHALEQYRVYGLQFDIGVFTNLTQDHLDFHADMQAYAEAKARLFSQCDYAVVNGDDPAHKTMLANHPERNLIYSAKDDAADLVAKNIVFKNYKVEYEALMSGSINRISVAVPGMFTVYNSMAAMGVGVLLGIAPADIAMALKMAKGVLGRYERVELEKPYDVIIDYAHTPDGMENILSMTRNTRQGRIISVFGCGGDRDKTKRPQMGQIATRYSDIVVLTSDNSRSERPMEIIFDILWGAKDGKAEICVIPDRKKAILYAMTLAQEGDTLLLLGKGHELYQEINGERSFFDEREIVKQGK